MTDVAETVTVELDELVPSKLVEGVCDVPGELDVLEDTLAELVVDADGLNWGLELLL